ncbi:MAG: trypsin-like serine protease [Verrucomicrobiae bacterium]|nr:trypsin-like serine protease [Verrucomicrobiae bacterium]
MPRLPRSPRHAAPSEKVPVTFFGTRRKGARHLFSSLAAILTLAHAPAALALYVRTGTDVSLFNALALDSAFEAAGFFTGGCSGVLVAADKVLTAGHCAGAADSAFGFAAEKAGATTYDVSSVVTSPTYLANIAGVPYEFDLAIATLSAPVPGSLVTPAVISSANIIGQTITMVGYGGQARGDGTALTGANDRLGAQNVIDLGQLDVATGGGVATIDIWAADFDSPDDPGMSLFGSSTPLALEGNLAGGDSGSALFWNNQLVGIGAYVFCTSGSGCIPTSTYGDGSLWVRMDLPENASFLQANGIAVVPLPAAFAPLLCGLAVLLTMLRRAA